MFHPMKTPVFTILILSILTMTEFCLHAQNTSDMKYYDPAQFYTLNADFRSEDGRARAIEVYDDSFSYPLLQVLTENGTILSSKGWNYANEDRSNKALHLIRTKEGTNLYLYICTADAKHGTTDRVAVFRVGKKRNLERVPIFKTSRQLLDEIECHWYDHETIRDFPFAYVDGYDFIWGDNL